MAVRDTLNKIEDLVAHASHLPLTAKALIDEYQLVHLIDELRNALPQELNRAEEIIRTSEEIKHKAKLESEQIIQQAKEEAEKLSNENEVVTKARERAQRIETKAQQNYESIITNARNESRQFHAEVTRYAMETLDNLISEATVVSNSIRAAGASLENALKVLQQSKIAFNNQAYNYYQQQQPNYQQQQQNYQQQQQNYQQQQQNYQQQPNYLQQSSDYPKNPQN